MFDIATCTLLQQCTTSPPSNEYLSGAWTSILFTLFPRSDYVLSPHRRRNHVSDLVIEVLKLITLTPSLQFRTVLIVEIKNSQGWEAGIPSLERQINRLAVAAFSGTDISMGTTISKVYWIAVIGPHWRYGIKEDGQDLRPLIAWHETTHDQASYDDFGRLTTLIADM